MVAGRMSILRKSLQSKRGIRRYIGPKRVGLLALLGVFLVVAWDLHQEGSLSPAAIEGFRDQNPLTAVAVFILLYAISVVAVLPSLPLNLAAGFFWGGFPGGCYSAFAVTIGGWVSFQSSRWLLGQPLAERFEGRWMALVQEEFDKGGWKFVAFARINPVIPTGPLNYLLGLTSLSNRDFLWVSFVFLLPPSIAMAFIGETLQTFAVKGTGVEDFVRGILVVSAAVTALGALRFASSVYKKRTEKE